MINGYDASYNNTVFRYTNVFWDTPYNYAKLKDTMSRISPQGIDQERFILESWQRYHNSPEYNDILTAKRYFRNKNDILKRKRQFRGRKGEMIDDPILANNKLSHAFLNKITRQKVNYLLAKPFTINSDTDGYADALNDIFGKADFRSLIKRVVKEAIIAGLGWVQVYYDEMGKLKFQRIPCEQVLPFWKDTDHTELEAVVRRYTIEWYKTNDTTAAAECEEIVKFEFWFEGGVYYYEQKDGILIPDPDKIAIYGTHILGHFMTEIQARDADGNPMYSTDNLPGEPPEPIMDSKQTVWDQIPIVPFKYNMEEMSLLDLIKNLIDDYDARTSDNSNQIEDIPNSIKLVKGYEGTDPDMFIDRIRLYRVAFVNHEGEMSSVDNPLGIEQSDPHLERLRKDIYEFGFGVDTQESNVGNASGVALKFLYADLDMDCSDLASELTGSLEKLAFFLAVDLAARGDGDYLESEMEVIYNTDITINETETIENLVKSGLQPLSQETLLEQHPYVINAQVEMDRKKREEEEALELYPQQQFMETPIVEGNLLEEEIEVGD